MSTLQIRFAQVDPGAKSDIVGMSSDYIMDFSNINDLKYDNLPAPMDIATLEHNFWTLDGSKEIFPEDPTNHTFGIWTESKSDDDGLFIVNPTLSIYFASNHKAPGLTFGFYPGTSDFVRSVKVTWYNSSNGIIMSGEYTMTGDKTSIEESVENFRSIYIEFITTAIPNRYIKLYSIDMGRVRIIRDEEIDSCNIYEEVDPTIESIGINTINADIRTLDPFFSPLSSLEADNMMMKRQLFTATRDGEHFGTFFLETWEDVENSGVLFNFEGGDAVSILDQYEFEGGLYTNMLATTLLDQIFDIVFPTGVVSYEIDNSLKDRTVTGWIPYTTCGTAFQHIMFALNAISDTSRSSNVQIYPRDIYSTFQLPLEDQYRGGSTKPTTYYSGVSVTTYNYVRGKETVTPQNGTLTAGQYKIRFAEPLYNLVITGTANILKSHVNYAIINVTSSGEINLTGTKYNDNALVKTEREELPAGEVENIKEYKGYTLVPHSSGQDLAEEKFEFLKNRIEFATDIILKNRGVGYIINAETKIHPFQGTITRLDINLRSDKAEMTAIGHVYEPITGFDFTNMVMTGDYIS